MTKEEAIKTLRELWRETNDSWYEEVYNMAIEALQRTPNAFPTHECVEPTNECVDLISRQAAIDVIIEDKICDDSLKIMTALGDGDKAETVNMTCDRHAKMLINLPSAQPERKKGEWDYEKINSYTDRTYCPECGSQAPFVYVADDHYGRLAHGEIRKTNFCPNCGADMRGADDER